ncbi:MAG: hypothetical protein PHR28_04765 [candidate division Zixibacteria bacterium]|nr:hypothetical protein [candidate division Zixibacteria bacterium]
MKKAVCLTLTCLFFVVMIAAPALAKKAGEVKDDVYTDGTYKFSLKVPTGWSPTIKAEKFPLRLVLTQKSYPVPEQFQGNRDYAQIPTISVLVDTTSLSVEQFVDSLLDSKYKSKQKQFFVKNMPIIAKFHDVLKRSNVTAGDAKGLSLAVRQAYTVEVAQSGSDMADVIQDYKSGQILVIVRNGLVYVIHGICEYKLNSSYEPIFNGTFASLKFE